MRILLTLYKLFLTAFFAVACVGLYDVLMGVLPTPFMLGVGMTGGVIYFYEQWITVIMVNITKKVKQ